MSIVKLSVQSEGKQEALRHKWIASEKVGHDLGEQAIQEWIQCHWCGFLRERWLEHLHGQRYWIELDRGDFGLLQRAFRDREELLRTILDRLKRGRENLVVIWWAQEHSIPMEQVIEILEALDINSRRLIARFN